MDMYTKHRKHTKENNKDANLASTLEDFQTY